MEAGALMAFPAIPAYSLHASFKVRAPPSTPFTSRSRHILINRRLVHEVRATATAGAIEHETRVQPNNSPADIDLFACPICYEPLLRKGPPGIKLDSIYRSGFKCRKCGKSFTSKDVYLDLTVTSGAKAYNEFKPARTELFRSPLVSFLYERGWRQNFNRSGFPGRDEEFSMAQEYFKAVAGGLLVDVSCGSGLFSRKFAASGTYSSVIALDFSENMLRQCYEFIKQDDKLLTTKTVFLDVKERAS